MEELIKKNKRRKEIWDYHAKDTNNLCGDEVEIFLDVHNDTVVDACFDGKGCVISQVSASLLIDYIKGKSLEEIKKIDEETIKKLIGTEISPSSMGCATLCLNVLKKSLNKKYILAVHESHKGDIVGVVDKEILGKYYEEENKVLDLTSPFYKGKESTFREVIKAIESCYTANIVGNNIVKDLISSGKINKENVKKIKDIMYVHIYRI